MKHNSNFPGPFFSKNDLKKIKKEGKRYTNFLSSKLSPVDALLYQQRERQIFVDHPPDKMRLDFKEGGVCFGLDLSGSDPHIIGKCQQEDGHILVVGRPGCHKTTGVVLPTILTWRGPFAAVDVKGDLTDFCARHHDQLACPTIVIDFTNQSITAHFDPFQKLRNEGEDELIANARELALSIIPLSHDILEPFWTQGAQNILTGIILYAIQRGASFNEMVQATLANSAEMVIRAIRGSGDEKAKSFVSSYHPESNDKTLQGSFVEVDNQLLNFSDVQVQKVFGGTECINFDRDTVMRNTIIRIPESKISQLSGAVRLVLRQLFSTLSHRPEKYSFAGRYQPPFLLLWDEMPRFGKFEDLTNTFSTSRSKNVTICATLQSLAQLDHIYGPSARRSLVDCCSYIVIGSVQDVETQKYCSELVGTAPRWEPNVSDSYHIERRELTFSRGLNLCREPIVYPEEFATFDDFIVVSPFGKFRLQKSRFFENDCSESLQRETVKKMSKLKKRRL